MLKDKIQKELNKQINHEMFSSYLYLSMSACCAAKNLNGFANWMRVQAQEELMHAMKIYDYVNERGGRVVLDPIEKPKTEWKTVVTMFEETYKHEQFITSRINTISDVAITEKDHATVSFMQWFVNEQVEEEANASQALEQLRMIKDAPHAIFMMDREMGQRVFTPPAATAAT
jgi:ferritin